MKKKNIITISGLFFGLFMICSCKPAPETPGEKIDNAVEESGEAIEEAGDAVGDALEDASN